MLCFLLEPGGGGSRRFQDFSPDPDQQNLTNSLINKFEKGRQENLVKKRFDPKFGPGFCILIFLLKETHHTYADF